MALFSHKNCFEIHKDKPSLCIKAASIDKGSKYTFIIPTYKRVECLKLAIDSILAQDYKDFYYIIVGDNNPIRYDDTENLIISQYNHLENLSYYKHTVNLGPFGNWNRLLELCKTDYAVMLHDDDYLLSDFLSRMDFYVNKMPDISYFKCNQYLWNGVDKNFKSTNTCKLYIYDLFANISKFRSQAPTGCVMKVEDFTKVGGFDEDEYPSADYTTLLNILASGGKSVLLRDKLMLYRIVGNDTSKIETQLSLRKKDNIIKRTLANHLKSSKWYILLSMIANNFMYDITIHKFKYKKTSLFDKYILKRSFVKVFFLFDDLFHNIRCSE